MRVVLDTCILFSSLHSSSGASHRIISKLGNGYYVPVVSTPVFFEYEDVLSRTGQFEGFTAQDVDDFLDYFANVSERVKVNYLWRPFLPDPDDDLFLELAVAAKADCIVTYNLKHFLGTEKFGIRVHLPKDFIKEAQL